MQLTLVTRAQLLSLGVSGSAISRATGRSRLFRVHQGIYSTVPPAIRPRWAAELAALLAHGRGAVLSHGTAARVHGIMEGRERPIHVTVAHRGRHQQRPGIVVHRTVALTAQEHHRVHGLLVTSVARTVIDLSPALTARRRERLIDEALKKSSRAKLIQALESHPGRPGTPAIRSLLDPRRPSSLTWSEQEERLLRLIRRAGLPVPEHNVELDSGYRPDLLWREQRVIVEYDSEQHHRGPGVFHHDRTRHNRLEADGYRVLHVTHEHLRDRPEEVLVWIAQALVRGERG